MKIVIIGDGKVGFTLAENLSRSADNEVTIIDKNAEALRNTIESLDVRCIKGNGVSAGVLREAGVSEADLLIAATSSDEMNMVCCLTGKRLGARHTIARIRDPEYADELSTLKDDLELDMVINPERAMAGEIVRLLEFPTAANVEVFARGRVEMVEIKATDGMTAVNMPLKEVSKRLTSSILIGAIQRGGEVIIPSGEEIIRAGDSLHIVGQPARIFQFCAQLGLHQQKIKNVMIVGGGRVAYYLAKYLDEIDVKVKILEIKRERCLELNELLPKALIIHGDGSDDRVLRSENLGDMDCFISVTGIDEENLMTALLAKHCGVPKVVAKINRTGYTEVINHMGIDNLIQPKLITSNHILRYVRGVKNAVGNPVNSLYKIVGGAAEAVEFTAGPAARLLDTPLKKLKLIKGVLVAVIARKNEVIIPHGNDMIRAGDAVVLLSTGRELTDLDDILAEED
ncbi:MAG: Trk system potassium transporter TrkA [Oscillospiraceae bacterium]|jgi:trk system potassium uptake protein TrkA|nr:Trk system potassium transporter TrkA [Oscillospiraceae bacterium]